MEKEIAELAARAIEDKVFPGCVIGMVERSGRRAMPFGRHTYASDSPAVTMDSLYDCASITKIIPTATIMLQLLDEKKLSLDDRLVEFIPEYRTRYRDEVTLRHLLTYTLGNTLPLSHAGETPDEIFAAVCTEDTAPPGSIFNYSNTPAFLLGIVIERIFDMSLDKAAQERIFNPLSMRSATFAPNYGHPMSIVAPTEEGVQGVVHDESARVFSRAHRTAGHAGLFSTISDFLNFLEPLLKNPDERLSTNQIPHLHAATALGWELNQEWMGKNRTSQTFGKTGFTGTSIVCNFEEQKAVVILSNRTYPHRPAHRAAIDTFRATIADTVFLDQYRGEPRMV